MLENWSINTSEFVGYSDQYPSGCKCMPLVPFTDYPTYWDAYAAAKAKADELGKTCFLGNASPYQVAVPPTPKR